MTTPQKTRLFGTDGIRGVFGEAPLIEETVVALGHHLTRQLSEDLGRPPTLLLAGDTRGSTPQISRWLAAGIRSAGGRLRYGGVLPTPAVAYLVRFEKADTGIAISASHNPAPDNGIKLISSAGFKWSVEDEHRLEARLEAPLAKIPPVPELPLDAALVEDYLDMLAASLPASLAGTGPLAGLRIALDAANGAASPLAGKLFQRLGATSETFFDRPDGTNINRGCGSTVPEALAEKVRGGDFHVGFAFDGDADRTLMVDEAGQLQDGDAILYLWAQHLAAAGRLQPPAVVATTMSNLGLERALDRLGIGLVRCGVGDRIVVETLLREGLRLGGEQSGHIVHLDISTSGDGLLTALQIAGIVAQAGQPVSQLLQDFRRFPQILLNVPVRKKPPFNSIEPIRREAQKVEQGLGQEGRLLLRYSGTEPLARVMIEGAEQAQIEELAEGLAAVIREHLGR